ncbi:hypothetical protein BCO37747_00200 [Burkholderia contaminans]|jgi:hypothetical protein|nr:hypothetical protein SK875_C00086 [Burkholderia contaminans]VWB57479.1 hypothetical protein BCO23253_02680 [Burkholderia contaminans]VWC66351.1 hypothetical protein BCO37747_00200 [Burkholderia contaminans]
MTRASTLANPAVFVADTGGWPAASRSSPRQCGSGHRSGDAAFTAALAHAPCSSPLLFLEIRLACRDETQLVEQTRSRAKQIVE